MPYLWDLVVGTITTATMEWSRNKIQVFPLNEDVELEPLPLEGTGSDDANAHDNTPDVV